MRDWTVVPQIEFQNCEPVSVLCRHVRTSPVVDAFTGETSFRLLPDNLFILQVIVETDREQHKLRIIEDGKGVTFVWQKPDRPTRPTCKSDRSNAGGRYVDSRQETADMLSPLHRVPGEKAEFTSKDDFTAHLNRILGRDLSEQVMELFRWRRPLCLAKACIEPSAEVDCCRQADQYSDIRCIHGRHPTTAPRRILASALGRK
jgi:hypothetical protein